MKAETARKHPPRASTEGVLHIKRPSPPPPARRLKRTRPARAIPLAKRGILQKNFWMPNSSIIPPDPTPASPEQEAELRRALETSE